MFPGIWRQFQVDEQYQIQMGLVSSTIDHKTVLKIFYEMLYKLVILIKQNMLQIMYSTLFQVLRITLRCTYFIYFFSLKREKKIVDRCYIFQQHRLDNSPIRNKFLPKYNISTFNLTTTELKFVFVACHQNITLIG